MAVMELDARDLLTVANGFAAAPAAARRELRRFLARAVMHLQAEVVERTPKARGALQRSIIGNVLDMPGLGVEGVVGTSLAYAAPVELGTQPHWAPIEPLKDWVRAKANLEGVYFDGVTGKRPRNQAGRDAKEAAIERIARRIQVSIARRGTLGVGMFHGAMAANAGWIKGEFADCAARIAALTGGAQ